VTWHVVIALVYLIAGALAVYDPVGAAIGLTLVIAIALLVTGVTRLTMSFQLKPAGGWIWTLLSGIMSIVLGGIILAQWPATGLWVIGLVIAIELIVSGWSYIFVALAAKNTGTQSGATAAPAK